MISAGFLDPDSRQELVDLARDGSVAHRLARRANALLLLDGGMSCEAALTRHLDPLLLGKRSKLPSVEDCQPQPVGDAISATIAITGIDDRDRRNA
jgi:hypothetical protein